MFEWPDNVTRSAYGVHSEDMRVGVTLSVGGRRGEVSVVRK